MSFMRNSVEVIPPFNALSLILTNCSQLTPHTIKHPLTPTWLGRRDGNWLWQAVHTRHFIWCEQLLSQLNSIHHETDDRREDVTWHQPLRKVLKLDSNPGFFLTQSVCFPSLHSCDIQMSGPLMHELSDYRHTTVLTYFCFVCLMYMFSHDTKA